MLLQPSENWCWNYDRQQERLQLELSEDMIFVSSYSAKELIPAALENQRFSVEDTKSYYQLTEALLPLDWPVPLKVQLMLNSIAVQRFYKPKMPQSWFFTTSKHKFKPSFGQIVRLCSPVDSGFFLVIEAGDCASFCLLIDERMTLNPTKQLNQFSVIKVMNDRLWQTEFSQDEDEHSLSLGIS
ncbi:cell division protein ZapC [Dongshaea marina]|uniref:cell division protein ZapC n=1 Tax=Dongshaea marina TaxID=2047966 RepID=UPI000D3EBB0C|nr:cell division protein ZapC [Dongshaea marina]